MCESFVNIGSMCKNSSWLVHLAVPAGCKKLAKETGCCAAATRCTPTESTLPVRPIEGGENQAIFPSVFEGLRGLRGKPGIFAIDQSLAQEFRLEYVYICGSMYVDRNPARLFLAAMLHIQTQNGRYVLIHTCNVHWNHALVTII